VVREGAARAEVSAEFDTRPRCALAGRGRLRRRRRAAAAAPHVDAQGKSRAWINGSAATVAQLREAADHWSTSTASTPGRA
jgi:DNA repair protein RecN (Recombination protein N)